MNSRQRRSLAAIFADPVSPAIVWADLEVLLIAAGCKLSEGSGSRVKFSFGAETVSFHRPHPGKEAIRYQVRDARAFLEKIGVRP